MPKVTFHYSFKEDAWSWVLIARNRKNLWGLNWKQQVAFVPDDLLNKIIKQDKNTAEKLVYDYLLHHPKKSLRQLAIREKLVQLEKIWKKVEKKSFKRLREITQKPIFATEFKCYITTGFMCPYDEKDNAFMVSLWHGTPFSITTICHEILHLQFLHYYENYCLKHLSRKQLEDLKEALTFILNTDFNDLLLTEDVGYPSHQKLRSKLKEIWARDNNFDSFLNKAINAVKSLE